MSLDSIAVNLKCLGGLDDIAVINHEPMEEVMAVQVLGKEITLPQTIQGGKTGNPFRS